MAGRGFCTDPKFVAFIATTVSIKGFILIVCINIYFAARQTDLNASRNSRPDPIEIINTNNFHPKLSSVDQGNEGNNQAEKNKHDLFRTSKSNTPLKKSENCVPKGEDNV